jgi:transcriptional regulator with XRE-family HTH domain
MNNTTTIRIELEDFIKWKGLNMSQLAKRAGLNSGTVSSILKGNRVMGVDQLDRLTSVLELPKGHFYEQYLQECMVEAVPNWRRIRPFLFQCAELDKLDCIQKIVVLLLDNLTYSPLLFEVAEDFFKEGKRAASALLYESVASSERRQHSERLAFCEYRLFTLRLGDDQARNLQVALQFEIFVDRLDEIDQLDALKDLASTYRSLRRWDKVEEVAREMGYKANIQYQIFQQSKRNEQEHLKRLSRPLFSYLSLSNLLRASVCDARGDYEQALQFTYAYADLSWVTDQSEEAQHWIRLFEEWAKANIYVNKILSGDISVISNYMEYIKLNTDETLPALLNILEAANRYQFNIDNVLKQFEFEILSLVQQQLDFGVYTQQVISDHLVNFLYKIAYYYLSKKSYLNGFKYLLDSLEKSAMINNEPLIVKNVRLFESFRRFASQETQTDYYNLMREEEENEKENGITTISD